MGLVEISPATAGGVPAPDRNTSYVDRRMSCAASSCSTPGCTRSSLKKTPTTENRCIRSIVAARPNCPGSSRPTKRPALFRSELPPSVGHASFTRACTSRCSESPKYSGSIGSNFSFLSDGSICRSTTPPAGCGSAGARRSALLPAQHRFAVTHPVKVDGPVEYRHVVGLIWKPGASLLDQFDAKPRRGRHHQFAVLEC